MMASDVLITSINFKNLNGYQLKYTRGRGPMALEVDVALLVTSLTLLMTSKN